MYPNLETEQARFGRTEEDVAQVLGITQQAYRARKKSGAFRLAEALALAQMYGKPVEYLFRRAGAAVSFDC